MPDIRYRKHKPPAPQSSVYEPNSNHPYAELEVTSNFSFLRGGSHPEELIETAASLGYRAIAITDFHSLSGVVRAHGAAKHLPIQLIVGCRLLLSWKESSIFSVLVYPRTRDAYGRLCRLLTQGNLRSAKGASSITVEEFIALHQDMVVTLVYPASTRPGTSGNSCGNAADAVSFSEFGRFLCDSYHDKRLLSLSISRDYGYLNQQHIDEIIRMGEYLGLPLVATGNIYYHAPERRALHDVLTCIREKTTVHEAGFRLLQNAERWLKPRAEIWRLFRDIPGACRRSLEIAELCEGFSLDQLRYEYPEEVCPQGTSPMTYLKELTERGAQLRYPQGVPSKVRALLEEEYRLIAELNYAKYFLTCYHIVQFAQARGILCQGRGAAANSAVCFCLGITAVDPSAIDLLFARFISKERDEPPDIDIDFEHERREEVIQYIYERFGRERAGLTCEVITYRYRSAVRDVGKALGLPPATVDRLAKTIHRWTDCRVPAEELVALGLNPRSPVVQNTFILSQQLLGFPRHLSQHVGGFIISQRPLCETVPIGNAGMASRTIIEWDKDDIETLGMLKIDVLALGMLTCIRKALSLINQRIAHNGNPLYPLALHSIPKEDPQVYDMICRADTIGVFQIESRAQMSMLPRLKPRCFYDLVIEVAIVRPGPIQGNMVHPFLKRRAGLEKAYFPDQRVASILGKTLGVPIFQEQAMRLAIVLANFSPGEAEQLRRAMAAWKRDKGVIATFKKRIIAGMQANGYSLEFAEHCMNQIKGFSEYGFPESHAASFALLVYASAWIKCHFPAEFTAALLNSQPMGFYAPSQIISDAKNHHVRVLPIDVNKSAWETALEHSDDTDATPALRLGMHLIKGLSRSQASLIIEAKGSYGTFISMQDLWHKAHLYARSGTATPANDTTTSRLSIERPPTSNAPTRSTLIALAHADAFQSLGLSQRHALWELRALPESPTVLDTQLKDSSTPGGPVQLPLLTEQRAMFQDYRMTGLSLRAHPLQFVRASLHQRGVSTSQALKHRSVQAPAHERAVRVAGLAIVRQRPGTAKGVVFITLEDETGITNLIIRPDVFDMHRRIIISSIALLAEGVLERVGEVVYVSTTRLESLDHIVLVEENTSLPSLSYSY